MGIAYDGATWEEGKNGQKRRTLDNKVAYASFDSAKEFRRKKEGLLASRFDVDGIDLRVLNGDGANWIQ
ncbi:ISLre2 family transposase, partial [Klebsiella pneumoniae]|nr:ISLre2 family transposase [Klebsiella pneumoniae]